jgi:tetratricopeptide (TPR) repeat protein
MRGHLHEGRARLTAILAEPTSKDHRESRIRVLEAAGGIAYWQGDMRAAQAFYNECLELTRAGNDNRATANAIYNASFPMLVDRTDITAARRLLEEALELYREVGDNSGIGKCQWAISTCLYYEERFDEAIAANEEAIEIFRRADNRFGLGWALHTRALLALKKADIAVARTRVQEALALFAAAGDMSGIVLLLDDAAEVASAEGNRTAAIRLAAAAAAHQEASGAGLGTVVNVMEGRKRRDYVVTAEDELAWSEGKAMTVDQAIALTEGRGEAVTMVDN